MKTWMLNSKSMEVSDGASVVLIVKLDIGSVRLSWLKRIERSEVSGSLVGDDVEAIYHSLIEHSGFDGFWNNSFSIEEIRTKLFFATFEFLWTCNNYRGVRALKFSLEQSENLKFIGIDRYGNGKEVPILAKLDIGTKLSVFWGIAHLKLVTFSWNEVSFARLPGIVPG